MALSQAGGEEGPASGTRTARPTEDSEPPGLMSAPRSGFSAGAGRDCLAVVISHVTEHQSAGRDGALAPAEADLQTLAGNTITQPPPPTTTTTTLPWPSRAALMRLEERREGDPDNSGYNHPACQHRGL